MFRYCSKSSFKIILIVVHKVFDLLFFHKTLVEVFYVQSLQTVEKRDSIAVIIIIFFLK